MRGRLLVFVLLLAIAIPSFGAITGTVMTADGQAIAGAKVSLHTLETIESRRARHASDKWERTALAGTASDANGRFSLESPKDPVVDVVISASGYAPASIRAERDDDLGGIALTPAPAKEGRVTVGGKGVANARVLWFGAGAEWIAVTDAEGRYRVPDPSKWADRVVILHPDYALFDEITRRFTAGDISTDRALQTGISLSGVVVGEDGKTPAQGATILYKGWPVATTGENGEYTIAHLDPKWERVEARFRVLTGARARASEKFPRIRLGRAAMVSGIVRDGRTQAPVAGTEVVLRRAERFDGGTTASAITDAKGNFSISGITPGAFELLPNHPAFTFNPVGASLAAGDKASRTLLGTQLARVSGMVISEEKLPVAGTTVSAQTVSRQAMPMFIRGGARQRPKMTAPDGRFTIRVEPDVDLQVEGRKKGYPEGRSSTLRLVSGERKSGLVITIPSGVTVTGRVTDRDGKGLAGVSVTTLESRGMSGGMVMRIALGAMRSDEGENVQTAEDGTFSIRVKEGSFDFAFSRDGYGQKVLRAQQVNTTIKPLEVTLEPAVEISGRVTRNGGGVAGVRVNLFGEGVTGEAETAGDGSFRIGNLSPGTAMLNVSKEEEFIQQFRPVTIPASDIVVDVPPGGRITGRVVDKNTKQPVTTFDAGISAPRGGGGMVIMGPPQSRSFTSDDGTFVLDGVPAGTTNVVVNAAGYVTARVPNITVEEGKTVANVEVEMDRGVKVTGKVTGPDGAAIAGVAVRSEVGGRRMMGMPGAANVAVTDANGEFVMEAQERGERTFTFTRSGYVATTKTANLTGSDTRVDAQMSTGMRVTGVVVTEGGAPVADASVSASSAGEPGGSSTRTDQNGTFQMEGLASGRYTFRAFKQGYPSAELRDTDIASGAPIRIVVRTGGTIYGRVTGLSSDELSSATVVASSPSGNATGAVDSVGNYRIEGSPTGTVRISARTSQSFAGGKSSPVKSVQVEAGSSVQADIEFLSGTAIRGRVTRDGQPVPGAMISFFPRKAQAQTNARTQTDTNGYYEVTGLEDATYDVGVADIQRGAPYTTTYEVRGSGTFNIEMKSSPLRGRVVDAATGQPVGDAAVEVRERDTGSGIRFAMRTLQTDASGGFVIDAISPGSYHVSAEKDGYGTKVVDVNVGDSPQEVEIKLTPNPGVTLKVVDGRDGRAITGAFVRVMDQQDRIVYESPMRFMAGGTETTKIGLDPGTYRLTVFAPSYASRTLTISSPSTQTIPLTPGGTIMVRSQTGERRRARLMASDGREYPRGFGGGIFWIDPSPGITQMQNIAPGVYTLQILGSRDEVLSSAQVQVSEGQNAVIEI